MPNKMIAQHDAEMRSDAGRAIGMIVSCVAMAAGYGWLLWAILH